MLPRDSSNARRKAQSIELFRNARMPAELHLFSEIDHFIFSDDNRTVLNLVTDWLRKFFPARQRLGLHITDTSPRKV